jgi:hypothetical protein
MSLPSDLINKLCIFLNYHELSCITGSQCTICANYKNLKILDKDIDQTLIENYCKSDKSLVDKLNLKRISNKAQRIHILGNHWPLVNCLKHRKFSFFSKQISEKNTNKESICITDTTKYITKTDNQLIITQGYSKDYNLSSVDYLLIEKKYIDESFEVPFDIPEKGFLVIDLNNNKKFYTE